MALIYFFFYFFAFFFLSRQTNDKFGIFFFSNFSRLHLITVAKSWWNLTWICWKSLKSTPSIYFFAKQLFSSFLPVNRTKNLVIFFSQIFKGFTLLPWQKVGRIWLGFAGNHSDFQICLFVCLLSCFSLLFKISFVCLFVKLFFLPFFLSLKRQTNDHFGNFFFQILQGFTLVPWQKVGRISSNSLVFLFVC